MKRPKRIFAPLAAILAGAVVLSVTVGKDFLPPMDEGAIWIQVQLPPGISIEKSKEMGAELRRTLKRFDEVSYVMTQVGRDDEGAEAFSLSHVECGVGLKPYNTWESGRTKSELIDAMAVELQKMPGYSVGFSQPIIDMVMDQVAGAAQRPCRKNLRRRPARNPPHRRADRTNAQDGAGRRRRGGGSGTAAAAVADHRRPRPDRAVRAERFGCDRADRVRDRRKRHLAGFCRQQVVRRDLPAERRVPEHARKDRVR